MFCYCMGYHTFQALFLRHRFHFVYLPPAYQMVDDQQQVYWQVSSLGAYFKVIHWPSNTHQNANTMSWRPLTTSKDLSKTRQDFD
jgi:hypothetical protein